MDLAQIRLVTALLPRVVDLTKLFALMEAAETTAHQPSLSQDSEDFSQTPTAAFTLNSSAHPVKSFHQFITAHQPTSAALTSFNALMVLASLTFLSALKKPALPVLFNVGMVIAKLLLADAHPELPAQMTFQPSALMALARPLLLTVMNTLNVQSSSHTDVGQVNADQEAKTAQRSLPAHLKCQSNVKTKAASDLSSTVILSQLAFAKMEHTDALMVHALLPNPSAQPLQLAQLVKSDAGTTNARTTLHSALQSSTTLWSAQPLPQFAAQTAHAEADPLTAQLQSSAQLKSQFFATMVTAVNQVITVLLTLAAHSAPRDALMVHASEPLKPAVLQSPAQLKLHINVLI